MKIDELINIYEIFNTSVPVQWEKNGVNDVGNFTIENTKYRIRLEPGFFKSPGLGHTYTFLNIAFAKIVNGEEVFDLSPGGPHASKVFGAVINGIALRTEEFSRYDAVVFIARDNVAKRMPVYNHIARHFAKQFGTLIEDIKTSTGPIVTILVKNGQAPETRQFVDYLKDQGKVG